MYLKFTETEDLSSEPSQVDECKAHVALWATDCVSHYSLYNPIGCLSIVIPFFCEHTSVNMIIYDKKRRSYTVSMYKENKCIFSLGKISYFSVYGSLRRWLF